MAAPQVDTGRRNLAKCQPYKRECHDAVRQDIGCHKRKDEVVKYRCRVAQLLEVPGEAHSPCLGPAEALPSKVERSEQQSTEGFEGQAHQSMHVRSYTR